MSNLDIPKFQCVEFSEKNFDYCVCVFVINEGNRLLNQLKEMSQLALQADIVISDGGSTDGSTNTDVLKSYGVNSLLVKDDFGKLGSQMRIAFSWAMNRGYKGVVVIDGNNKDSVVNINDFVLKLSEGWDHVQGSRFIPGGEAINTPITRLLGLKLIHAPLMRLASGFQYTDTTNGFRAYSMNFLLNRNVGLFRSVFTGYELHYYLARTAPRLNFKCIEIPVTRKYPQDGRLPTKITPIQGNFNVLKKLFSVVFGKYDLKNTGV
ncbi:glycosyltransferase family 2 protein [Thalassotalea sp. G20_0]|uniref:glycosyltransferase family 2 protein n=1 Tax=Thalassotalea sp. G20_0 TaxID=2821093 RepID=UPI001ADC275A|nr:glycosyltransferase family 2 protein [Thalassotalea sp. G20_0]MBO9493572.1 glycosyltransferase family 2 protein [Thalassotalea sp. G20_0]